MHVVGILAVAGVLVSPQVPAMPVSAPGALAVIDPVLTTRVAADGFAPAILTWDRAEVTRAEVSRYLSDSGLDAHVLEGLSVAFACAGSTQDVQALAAAPGAVSVWGDRALTPALDRSVRTAFNGDPSSIWEGLGITGKGVSIGVVDTGVDATHPDLRYGEKVRLNVRVLIGKHDLMGPYTEIPGCPNNYYSEQVSDSEISSGHGTHLAGVAAGDGTVSGGRYTGVAPGAEIIAVGVADTVNPRAEYDQYTQLSLLGAIAGLNYVLYTGLEGCSKEPDPLSGGEYCNEFIPTQPAKVVLAGWTQEGLYDPWHPMSFIIKDLGWYGVNVVFPVGNEGPVPSDCSVAETCHFNPFAVGAIGVAATPKTSRTELEPYSSRGDPIERQARDELVRYEPLLSAPGTGVISARRPGVGAHVQPPGSILGAGPHPKSWPLDRRYVAMTGTSIAAAHVAGAIALMQEAARKGSGCYLPATDIANILRSTATPMFGYASWEVGAGALNVSAAVNAASGGGGFSPDPWMCPPA